MARESYRFSVTGRVQGVYFRQATVNKARELGLHGWVRNLPDGRVEGMACGEADELEQLRQWLHQGPPAARVEAVEWQPGQETAQGFELRR